jgi:CRISPR-associated protein, csd1 family
MILQSLDRYYDRLHAEKDSSGKPKVPAYGFSEEKIGWIIILSREGDWIDLKPHLTTDKKPQPKLMDVPRAEKRTSGIKSNFLWDKTAYTLGVNANPDKTVAKTQPFLLSEDTFNAFRKKHLTLLRDTQDSGLLALYRFLEKWQPAQFQNIAIADKITMLDSKIVFQLDGAHHYIHESEAAGVLWARLLQNDDSEMGFCLIDGKTAPIARLHPVIKGLPGDEQKAGGNIVSFNKESFASFGKEQGANAPISERAAFTYTTVLNYLLRQENGHCLTIGDTSTVFWAETADDSNAEAEETFFTDIMEVSDGAENQKVFDILQQIAKGRPLKEIAPELHEDTRFYILGLAPNASRISIRFWLNTTFGLLAQNLAAHWQDLAIVPCPWKTPPSLWRLLIQTAPLGKTKKQNKNISPILAGEMTRAIISGAPYPMSLLSQLLIRIRADHIGNYKTVPEGPARKIALDMANGLRIAMIKAILARKFRKGLIKEGVPMSLDKESTNCAYLLGRMFAVLERIQYQALGDINASIADRYYGSASAVPFSIFPRLLVGARHHLSRLRKDKSGLAVNLDKDLGEIIAALPEHYPRHFSIDEQGRFSIGYYQQKQSYFPPKEAVTTTEE